MEVGAEVRCVRMGGGGRCVTCSTDMDSHVTCNKKHGFYKLCAAARLSH